MTNIVSIDDDEDILMVTKLSLELNPDFKVTCFKGGADISEEVVKAEPDIILLDVMMPQIDGPAMLKLIRAKEPLREVPVVFMTARIQPAEVENYLQLGASAVITKPFDPMKISQQILDILS